MQKFKNQLSILLFTIAACVVLAFYVGFIRDEEIVYTHFFYIPIILAGVWYYRKAIYPALFLSIVHILVTHLSPHPVTMDNFARCAILIAVAYVIGLISEKQAKGESELRETRDYLEKLINYANAPIIVWDTEFRITRFNRAFEHLAGYTANEVIGKELVMLFPETSRDESLSKIARTLSGEYWESVEIPILCKNGDTRVALWNSANIYAEDGTTLLATIAQGTDITERERADDAQRKSEEHHRKVIENIFKFVPDGLLVFTDKLNLFRKNKAFQDIVKKYSAKLNYTEKELTEIIIEQVKNKIINKDYTEIRISKKNDEEAKNRQNNFH